MRGPMAIPGCGCGQCHRERRLAILRNLPLHMLPLTATVRSWEKQLQADPNVALIYADWCDENAWSERADQLRKAAGDETRTVARGDYCRDAVLHGLA